MYPARRALRRSEAAGPGRRSPQLRPGTPVTAPQPEVRPGALEGSETDTVSAEECTRPVAPCAGRRRRDPAFDHLSCGRASASALPAPGHLRTVAGRRRRCGGASTSRASWCTGEVGNRHGLCTGMHPIRRAPRRSEAPRPGSPSLSCGRAQAATSASPRGAPEGSGGAPVAPQPEVPSGALAGSETDTVSAEECTRPVAPRSGRSPATPRA
jgi:hypothetical protein